MTSWHQLDDFTTAYVECMLWAETDNSDESGGKPLDENYDWSDFAPELQAQIIADCKAFQEANLQHFGDKLKDIERAGHDFWLTRRGHGVTFKDGHWPEPQAQILYDAAKLAGDFDLYVGDDGLIYGS